MDMLHETTDEWRLSKCGEITTLFSVGKEEFFLSCDLCDFTIQNLDTFIQHVYQSHMYEFIQAHSRRTPTESVNQHGDEGNSNQRDNAAKQIENKTCVLEGFEKVVIDMNTVEMENSLDFKDEMSEEYVSEINEEITQTLSDTEVMEDNSPTVESKYRSDTQPYAAKGCHFGSTPQNFRRVLSLQRQDNSPNDKQYIEDEAGFSDEFHGFDNKKKHNINTKEDRKFIIEFIKLYRSLPALWDIKNKYYFNRQTKRKHYKILLQKYKEMYPNAVLGDVKKRINCLRTNYNKELRRIAKTGSESKLFYFEAIQFLRNNELQSESKVTENDLDYIEMSVDVTTDDEDTQSDENFETGDKSKHSEQKFILKFIELYRSLPLLWDVNAKGYNDHELRTIQYKILLEKYKEMYPNAKLKDIRKKINCLRTNYNKEAKRMANGATESKTYYYEAMSFLRKNELHSESKATENSLDSMEITYEDFKDNTQAEEYLGTDDILEETGSRDIEFENKQNNFTQNVKEETIDVEKLTDEQKFILELIEVYQSLPALWDVNANDYNDRETKTIQYQVLLQKYKEMYPDAILNDVKKKINSLRTNFRRELKRGPPYQLFYFDKLFFLPDMQISFEVIKDDPPPEEYLSCDDYLEALRQIELKNKETSFRQNVKEGTKGVEKLSDEQKFIFEFIEVYHNFPALWNVNINDYNDRELKSTQYLILLEKYKEMYPYAVLNDVKKKINSLRTNFRRELKRGPPFQLFYFDKMSFLRDIQHSFGKVNDFVRTKTYIESDSESQNSFKITERGSKIKTEKEFIIELINVYRTLTTLWDIKDKDYYNRDIRDNQWQILLAKYNEMFPDADDCELKKKIHCLRGSYRRELKRMSQLRLETSALYYFDAISFIHNIESHSESQSGMKDPDELEVESESSYPVQFTRPKSRLDDEQFINLAKTYQSYSCLWNEKDTAYRFSNRRREAMNKLLEQFNEISGLNLTKIDLVKEISQLRKICSNEKKHKITCKKIKNNYAPICPFHEHILFLEIDVTPFECSICGELLAGPNQHKIHLASHDGSLPFKCNICGHGFKFPNLLGVHLRRHVQDFIYSCEVCNKPCATSTELKDHLRNHTGEKPFVCDICGVSYRLKSRFKEHMQRHDKTPRHKCKFCTKAFYNGAMLKEHMSVHIKVRDKICNVCKKGFTTNKQLRQHKYIHDVEKRYLCKICEKRFAQYSGLKGHMKLHGTSLSTIVTELE